MYLNSPDPYRDWVSRVMKAKRAEFGVNCCGQIVLYKADESGLPESSGVCQVCGAVITLDEILRAHGLEQLGELDTFLSDAEAKKHA